MLQSIPADDIVTITPSVLAAGGTGLVLNGMVLTNSGRVPRGIVEDFADEPSVAAYFGAGSTEDQIASRYFQGFINSNIKPSDLKFVAYASSPTGAWMRGGSMASTSLTTLQGLSGTLSVDIDGTVVTSSSINLSTATSFSQAAGTIASALGTLGPQVAVVQGTITTTTLNVSSVTSGGPLALGQKITGAGITAGTTITGFGTGTGGAGTYTVSISQTVASPEAITVFAPPVQWDAIAQAFTVYSGTTGNTSSIDFATGAIAAGLALTQATGAILSQGAAVDTPIAAMDTIAELDQNWITFLTTFKPTIADMTSFAQWNSQQGVRYVYAMWDNDITVTEAPPGNSGSAGAAIAAAGYGGIAAIYEPTEVFLGAWLAGAIASIDFSERQGRTDLSFKGQAGITPGVITRTIANQLRANGYNFYGRWATSNQQFQFFNKGVITGQYKFIDSYVNAVWMMQQFQLALMILITTVKSLPYNQFGYGMVEAALLDPIDQAVNFGAIQPGVTLSQAQIAEVNGAAGAKIDTVLSTRGWYLQILDASPQVRQNRGTPPITFWYMDGESIQNLNVASVTVQ